MIKYRLRIDTGLLKEETERVKLDAELFQLCYGVSTSDFYMIIKAILFLQLIQRIYAANLCTL